MSIVREVDRNFLFAEFKHASKTSSLSSGYLSNLTNVPSESNSKQSLAMGRTRNRRLSWPTSALQTSMDFERNAKSAVNLAEDRNEDPLSLRFNVDGHGSEPSETSVFASCDDIYAKKRRSVSFCPEAHLVDPATECVLEEGGPDEENARSKSTTSPPGFRQSASTRVFVRNVLLPPDGDWGWTVATCGFFISFFTLGLIRSYGIPYAAHARLGLYIYSVAHSVLLCSVPLNEFVCFRIGPRKTALLGTIMVLVSFLASFSSISIPVNVITLAIVPGYGTSLCLVATQQIIRQYFYYRRLVALTFSASGSAIGLLMWPMVLDFFASQYSVSWTFFLVGVASTTTVICSLFYRPAMKYYRKYYIRYEISIQQDVQEFHQKMENLLSNDQPAPSQACLIRQVRQLIRHPSFYLLLMTVSLSNTGNTLAVFLIPVYLVRVGRTIYHAKLALVCLAVGDIVGRVLCARCSNLEAKKRLAVIVSSSVLSGLSILCLTYLARTAFYATVIFTTLFGLTCSNQWNSLYLQTIIKEHSKIEDNALIPAVGMGNLSQGLTLILATILIDMMSETMEFFGRRHFLYCMGAFSCIASIMIVCSLFTKCKYRYNTN